MIEMLIGVVALLYQNPNNLIPPQVQEHNVCTMHTISECETVASGVTTDPNQYAKEYGRGIFTQGAYMPLVAKRANRKGIARIEQVWNKSEFIKRVGNGTLGIIGIWNYSEQDKYFIIRSDRTTRGHTMCAVGTYNYDGTERIIARNTVGDSVGIMGYFLVDPKAVDEMFYFYDR